MTFYTASKGGDGTATGQGTLSLVDGTANTLTLSNSGVGTILTLGNATAANPSILNLEVGATADQIAITSGKLSTLGLVTVNITGLGGLSGTQQTLISAGTNSTTSFVISGTKFNLGTTSGNFGGRTVSLANDSATAGTKLFLNESAAASAGPTAFWTGAASAVAAQGGTVAWNNFVDGNTNTSNFSTNEGGTTNAAGFIDATTDVTFNATANVVAGSFTSTTLGQDFTIKSLNFSTASAVGIGGANTLTINGNGSSGITVASGAGNDTISSRVALGNSQTWTVTDAGNTLTASNEISGAGKDLTKAGAGILKLTGTNTYTGATFVNEGTLLVSGSIAGSTTTVASGATLGGSGGTTGDVNVSAGGTLAPGESGIGTLNTGALTLGGSSTFALDLGATAGDRVNVTGAVALNGSISLTIALGAQPTALMAYTIINGSAALQGYSSGGRFVYLGNSLNEGQMFTVTSNSFTQDFVISYQADSGSDVTLMAVPEPGSLVSLFGGLGMLAGLQRFRCRRANR